ncbi:hypothetical protein BTVI_133644 [Pitangus sulphuratus]|nr:hypothetical protein BTVI_133644 [Pitangus sulphuratus]
MLSPKIRQARRARSRSLVMGEQIGPPSRPSSPNPQERVLKCGWLKKQRSIMKNWQQRWFVLRGDQLFYYKDEEETKPQGLILLQGNQVNELPPNPDEPGKHLFEITPGVSRMIKLHSFFTVTVCKMLFVVALQLGLKTFKLLLGHLLPVMACLESLECELILSEETRYSFSFIGVSSEETNQVTCLVDEIVYLDFSKAFDTDSHTLLQEKLAAHGLNSAFFGSLKTGWMAGPRECWGMMLRAAGGQSLVGFPRAQFWGQSCLISLSVIWRRRSSAPSVYLQMTGTNLGGGVDQLEGRKALQKMWTDWIDGLRPTG